ncbi:nitric oxide-sensing protein NosP [Legionella maioricensis]|uniref:FIST C-terminal domain-containing protein n=1 Tax=Legionella maioricensis TaxID=2896528 RepID=A0A9X2CZ19_9GAMM|nr:nitric oxide-sensing protein NosP [Legionella maioricensis]MCL9683529.1 FIST C-terminal domain-containing protein [Legionella maioricensis]MCL9686828.1 FIST C-terminal domain-containing protein [Legionella maioricensis]
MSNKSHILSAQSSAKDARTAVREFHAAVSQPHMSLVVFFCSSHYALDELAEEMNSLFPDVLVVGCTTAGEIGPGGYIQNSLTGASFPSDGFTVVAKSYDNIQQFDDAKGQAFVNDLLQELEARAPDTDSRNTFALSLIDGLSLREEPIARAFQHALGNILLLGGSAGDDLQFKSTWIFYGGSFQTDRAVLTLVNTIYQFKVFKSQHFICGHERLVVTKAAPSQRLVSEINGYPANIEYARVIGVPVDELDSNHFSAFPMVVRINQVDYVRSIQKCNPDGSLTFYCAIDSGLVFMAAHGVNLVNNLEQTFHNIHDEIGKPQLVLACDCILRKLEVGREGLENRVEDILKNNNVIGFNSYGEQFMGVHINQTITGIAIGLSREKNHG